MNCIHGDQDGTGGMHCRTGRHAGRNCSPGVCAACLGIAAPVNRMMPAARQPDPWADFELAVRQRGSPRLQADLAEVNRRRAGLCGCGQRAILEQRFIEQHRTEVGFRG